MRYALQDVGDADHARRVWLAARALLASRLWLSRIR